MVEGEYESILLTFRLSRWLESSYLRLFYSPLFSDDDTTLFADDGIKQLHILGSLLELKVPGLGDNLLQVGAVHIPSFRLATRGLAVEAYVLQPLVPERLFLRVGYIHIEKGFEGSFVGPSQPVDQTISNLYALVNMGW